MENTLSLTKYDDAVAEKLFSTEPLLVKLDFRRLMADSVK